MNSNINIQCQHIYRNHSKRNIDNLQTAKSHVITQTKEIVVDVTIQLAEVRSNVNSKVEWITEEFD